MSDSIYSADPDLRFTVTSAGWRWRWVLYVPGSSQVVAAGHTLTLLGAHRRVTRATNAWMKHNRTPRIK